MAAILVVDDEESIRFTFGGFIAEAGHEVVCARNYDEAMACMSEREFDLVFADIILEGKTGIEFLRECRDAGLTFPVIVMTGYPEVETAAEAVRLGAFDYIAKPIRKDGLVRVMDLALKVKKAIDEKELYRLRLDAIFQSVEDAILTVDDKFVITEINEGARRLCGITREAIGKDIRTVPRSCVKKCLMPLAITVQNRRSVTVPRLECSHGDKTQVVDISTYPLVGRNGAYSGAVVVLRDESRVAHLERDLGERKRLHNILGHSHEMQKVYALIGALADSESSVLITGESGTGKELVAEALHYLGKRRSKPLVRVNCSALPETLLESELFGHVKGAFTGATNDRIGRFHRAAGGTIFLDEIGDLSSRMQSSLLRVLQSKEFERVGDSTPIKVDVRILAATNKDLRERVARGEFREDLLYRLEVVELKLPPLRNRRDDIAMLVKHFMEKFNKQMNKEISDISSDALGIFMRYPWPGNIRELEHALEHAFVLCQEDTILVDHLPSHLRDVKNEGTSESAISGGRRPVDSKAIAQALEKTGGNKKHAARLLGIDRTTLYRNLAKHKSADPS